MDKLNPSFLFLLWSLSAVTCPMNEILTASTGVIMSQSPGSGFPHFESCSWVVKVEPGYNITFTIEHFQTSRQFDELEIFDGEFCVEQRTRRPKEPPLNAVSVGC